MSFDPYQILGVANAAGVDEIRRAYRGLARRFHPDVNASPEAEERFKLLAQAYSVLSDQKRRALYDEFGEASLALGFDARRAGTPKTRRAAAPATGQDAAVRHRPEPDSSDVQRHLEIDLATSIRGGEVKVPSPSGALLSVKIPAGVQSGHRFRLKGRGRAGLRGGLPGDLLLEVRVLPHPFFHRQGHDLYLELPISIEEAWRGASIEIPTLEGWVRLAVPAGSRGGERLRLRGKGVPLEGTCGDLFVHLCVRLPERLEAAARSLERLSALYGDDLRAGLSL